MSAYPDRLTESLEGIERIRLQWEDGDLRLVGTPALSGAIQLEGEEGATLDVVRQGSTLVVGHESRRCRGDDFIIYVPTERCPPIEARFRADDDVVIQHVSAPIELYTSHSDVSVEGGSGPLTVETDSGDVTVRDRAGAVTYTGGGGDVEFERCTGPTQVRLRGGDIVLRSCSGWLVATTGGGDVSIEDPREQWVTVHTGGGDVECTRGSLAALRVHTGGGDVECTSTLLLAGEADEAGRAAGADLVESALLPGSIDLETGSGDVSIDVPDDVPTHVEIVLSGDLESDLPLVNVGRRGPRGSTQRYVGVSSVTGVGVAGGGADTPRLTVRVRTQDGDVRLRTVTYGGRVAPGSRSVVPAAAGSVSREPSAAASAPFPEDASDAPGEVMAILSAVERGALSVDEAEALLSSLGSEQ